MNRWSGPHEVRFWRRNKKKHDDGAQLSSDVCLTDVTLTAGIYINEIILNKTFN